MLTLESQYRAATSSLVLVLAGPVGEPTRLMYVGERGISLEDDFGKNLPIQCRVQEGDMVVITQQDALDEPTVRIIEPGQIELVFWGRYSFDARFFLTEEAAIDWIWRDGRRRIEHRWMIGDRIVTRELVLECEDDGIITTCSGSCSTCLERDDCI